MGKALIKAALFSSLLISLFISSSAQACSSYTSFPNNAVYSSCSNLPVLNSFLHWNYDQSAGTVSIAYRHTGITSTTRWIGWAINPSGLRMVGSQALVAYQNSNGSMRAYTSPVTSHQTSLSEGDLSFNVSGLSATYTNNEMTIFATLELTGGATTVNQVWQEGPVVSGSPSNHATTGDNLNSVGTVDFLSGQTTAAGGGSNSRLRRRNVHGVMNAVSWGALMPMGAMIARYLKVFKSANPAWFYLHIAVQSSAYVIGVAGWAFGIKLGSDSSGIQYDTHRNLGIALFALGTVQVFALFLRPKPDHKYRLYWNIYHHSMGYAVIILSTINISKGFDILDPEKKWKRIYIGILIFLGAVTAILEAFTWFIVLNRKRKNTDENKYPATANDTNGVSGNGGTRTHDRV